MNSDNLWCPYTEEALTRVDCPHCMSAAHAAATKQPDVSVSMLVRLADALERANEPFGNEVFADLVAEARQVVKELA